MQGLILILLGKVEAVRSHGGTRKGSIRSWSGLVYLARFCMVVFGLFLFFGECGSGGGFVGGWFCLQLSGSLCNIELVSGSLLNLIAFRLNVRFAWCLMGGIEASISRAYVGEVLNAAHMSLSALLCTFSRGLSW